MFNFEQHLFKEFFDEIKTDYRKWLFVADKQVMHVSFQFFKICRYGFQKIRLAKPNSKQQTVCKTFKNKPSRSIQVEKIREIPKSTVFPSFSAPTWLFFINLKTVFSVEYGLEKQIFWCPFRHILRRKNEHSY